MALGPDPDPFADDPVMPPQAVILPGQECRTPDGEHLTELADVGVRTWGSDADSPARSWTARSSHCWQTRSSTTFPASNPCSTGCSTCC